MKKIFFTLSLVLLGVLVCLILNIFVIDEIKCKSQYGFCNNQINEGLLRFRGKRYFQVINKINKYLKGEAMVEAGSFQFKFPDRLSVSVIERKPVTAIRTGGDTYYLISRDGVVLGVADTTVLPYMVVNGGRYSPGLSVEPDVAFSLKILRYMGALYEVGEGYYHEPDGFGYRIQNGPVVIFPKEGDEAVLIGSLRLIVQKISQKDWEYGLEKPFNQITIDLRYKNPVLK